MKEEAGRQAGPQLTDQLGGDAAQGAKHGPASMDNLQLTELGEGGGVGGQASSVPAVVTGELASQVAGGSARQATQVQGTVCSHARGLNKGQG